MESGPESCCDGERIGKEGIGRVVDEERRPRQRLMFCEYGTKNVILDLGCVGRKYE